MPIKTKFSQEEFESLRDQTVSYGDIFTATDDGSFVLDGEAVDGFGVGNIDSLRASVASERAQTQNFKRELGPWKNLATKHELTPAAVEELLQKKEELEDIDGKRRNIDQIVADRIASKETAWKEKVTAAETENAKLKTRLESTHKGNDVSAVIDKFNGKRQFLQSHLFLHSTVVTDPNTGAMQTVATDAHGQPLVSLKNPEKPMLLDEFAEGLKKQKEWADAFNAEALDGVGGAGNNAGGTPMPAVNPFLIDSKNLTVAGQLEKDNPDLAKRLKEQAQAKGKLHGAFTL